MMKPGFESLLDLAKEIAADRRAPLPSVIKEVMHYEIVQALIESGAARNLVFQGGTALRLCYDGNRYSEDLDFAGGVKFDASVMDGFVESLVGNVGKAYGLTVEIDQRMPDQTDSVPVGRWRSKILLPQQDRSLKQAYTIHLEVAEIPAYTREVRLVRPMPFAAAYSYRSLMLSTESRQEILADKIVALGGRKYLKHRDLWDIHMLSQSNTPLDVGMVVSKIADYHLAVGDFLGTLGARIDRMGHPETRSAFQKEMSRFLDGNLQQFLQDKSFVDQVFGTAAVMMQDVTSQIAERDEAEKRPNSFRMR